MIKRVLLVAWKGSRATQWPETLREAGYTVLLEDKTGERAWRAAKERGIEAVIIDGERKPTQGRQTGHSLRDTEKTENIPILWTNLSPDDAESVQKEVSPDMCVNAPTDAAQALEALNELVARHALESEQRVSAVPRESADPTLHAHIHSLMGTPAYVATWAERSEPPSFLIDPDALVEYGPTKTQPPTPTTASARLKQTK